MPDPTIVRTHGLVGTRSLPHLHLPQRTPVRHLARHSIHLTPGAGVPAGGHGDEVLQLSRRECEEGGQAVAVGGLSQARGEGLDLQLGDSGATPIRSIEPFLKSLG